MNIWREILPHVQRPSRYLGNEVNAVQKDPSCVKTWVALAFPDLYEIGMSHLGLKILYHILNRRSGIAAERVFAPAEDYEAQLRRLGYSLCSLESSRPLSDFDIVGFSLQYELSYTNILNMLDLGGIPLKASRREEDVPLVIGGGPGAFNPEPLAAFFDLFVLGDGEEVILEIVETYQRWKEAVAPKDALLNELSQLRGVYVPSFFHPVRGKGGRLLRIESQKEGNLPVERRVLEELEGAEFPVAPVVPFMQCIHDRITLEVSRGCTRGCRFCQAGILYRPVRERSPARLLELASLSLRNSGHEELSLSSLNVGEYSCLMHLLSALEADHTSISLPSLRPGVLNPTITEGIRRGRKTSFTLVPEAGTDRLRRVINKEVSEEALFEDVTQLLRAGWVSFKLYFMIGLPTETQEDIEGIVALCQRILRLSQNGKRIQRVGVSLSSFVPKAHTPFQWLPQEEEVGLREKLRFFQGRLRNRVFDLRWHDVSMSFLEAVFSRGDRELGPVVEEAWRRGCKFDSWGDRFSISCWKEAFEAVGLNPADYAYASKPLSEVLPWDHLHSGVDRDYLEEEYRRSLIAQPTRYCRVEGCQGCGLHRLTATCQEKPTVYLPAESSHTVAANSTASADRPINRHGQPKLAAPKHEKGFLEESVIFTVKESQRSRDRQGAERGRYQQKVRLMVQKRGTLKYLSHLEFSRVFLRACRRADIPLAYSQGNRSLPRISFGPALPVGIESEGERVDIGLTISLAPEEVRSSLNTKLPEGMEVVACQEILDSFPPPQEPWKFEIVLHLGKTPSLEGRSRSFHERAVEGLLGKEEILISKPKDGISKMVNIRHSIENLHLTDVQERQVVLDLELRPGSSGNSLEEVIRKLYGLNPDENISLEIKKYRN